MSLAAVGVGAAIVQGGLTRVVIPKIGERGAAFLGLSVAAVVYFLYAYADKGWMVYAIIPLGSLTGFTIPALQGIMSRTIPANAQGELQGAVAALSGLSMMVGPFLMTQVFAAFSSPGEPVAIGSITIAEGAPFYFPGASFFLAGFLTIMSIAVLFNAVGRIRRPRKDAQEEQPLEEAPVK